MKKKFNKN